VEVPEEASPTADHPNTILEEAGEAGEAAQQEGRTEADSFGQGEGLVDTAAVAGDQAHLAHIREHWNLVPAMGNFG
jgi:hypothetical protein